MSEAPDFGHMDGEHLAGGNDLTDLIRQAPWEEARRNAEMFGTGENEVVIIPKGKDHNNNQHEPIRIEDVDFVSSPEELGEARHGHTKIHFKKHLGKAAVVVATGVILGGAITIVKRHKK